MRDELSLLVRRVNNLEEEKDNENKELQEKIEEVRTENKELRDENRDLEKKIEDVHNANMELRVENKEMQEKIVEIRNSPFGYFCSVQSKFSAAFSVITYDRLLYSSQFGLQGDSPGIDINTGKFVSGFSGTWRVDFSLLTFPGPEEGVYLWLYKNGEKIPEMEFDSYRSSSSTGSVITLNTGGRSILLHLDQGDELYLAGTFLGEKAYKTIFCVSLEQADV